MVCKCCGKEKDINEFRAKRLDCISCLNEKNRTLKRERMSNPDIRAQRNAATMLWKREKRATDPGFKERENALNLILANKKYSEDQAYRDEMKKASRERKRVLLLDPDKRMEYNEKELLRQRVALSDPRKREALNKRVALWRQKRVERDPSIREKAAENARLLRRTIESYAEKQRVYARMYGGSHIKRVKSRGGYVDPERFSKKMVFDRDRHMCQYCKKKLEEKDCILDHYIPVSKGGSHTLSNCKTSCFRCNSSKSDRILNGAQVSIFDKINA